jgi:hypothetical protein
MELDVAQTIRDKALASVADVDAIVWEVKKHCDPDEASKVIRSVGSVVGHIHMDLLQPIYTAFPELDKERQ